ncbi:redox-sensing transcriptional repressor Rex [Motilibacter peucedani]|uniref:redox-sensing transcriptional repressor Rex n=1 Tax=Motilibacter peucedani TaxID=598650 RepID=UPI000EB0B409|nr:redox-sensing transcriptional repressor Rex [Motilibacter peucedani]
MPERLLLPGVPDATVARLPVYLRVLGALSDRGTRTVSSDELAGLAGVGSAVVRRDLSHLGPTGTRGVGYDVEALAERVSHMLGLTHERAVVIVGAGNLGSALAGYAGFGSRGFRVSALLDTDPAVVGTPVGDLVVEDVAALEQVVARTGAAIGVITTPGPAAQSVCDRLVDAGIASILSFAPTTLSVPDGVDVRRVDLSVELAILAFHDSRRLPAELGLAAAGDAS